MSDRRNEVHIGVTVTFNSQQGEDGFIRLLEMIDKSDRIRRLWDDRGSDGMTGWSMIIFLLGEDGSPQQAVSVSDSELMEAFAKYAVCRGWLSPTEDQSVLRLDAYRFTPEAIEFVVMMECWNAVSVDAFMLMEGNRSRSGESGQSSVAASLGEG